MNAQHTPGPWRYRYDPSEEAYLVSAIAALHPATPDAGQHIAVIQQYQPNAVNNARLIAAAPDLLAALQGVLRVADRQTVEFDAARAAIAKATQSA